MEELMNNNEVVEEVAEKAAETAAKKVRTIKIDGAPAFVLVTGTMSLAIYGAVKLGQKAVGKFKAWRANKLVEVPVDSEEPVDDFEEGQTEE